MTTQNKKTESGNWAWEPGDPGRLYIAILALTTICTLGTIGYTVLEGWSLFESFYMVLITVSTVGYQEVKPLTAGGRVLTMFLIAGGFGTAAYTLTLLAQLVIESRMFARRKMEKAISKLHNHYIICGYGRMGQRVAMELKHSNMPFVIIEKNAQLSYQLREEGLPVLTGDATDEELLKAANISKAKGLASALDSDANNLYIILTARELNENLVIAAYSHDDRANPRLYRAGATRVICPFDHAGFQMAKAMIKPAVMDFIDVISRTQLDLELSEVTIKENSQYANKALAQTNIRSDVGAIVVAIKKKDGTVLYNPNPQVKLEVDDTLVALGQPALMPRLYNYATGRSVS